MVMDIVQSPQRKARWQAGRLIERLAVAALLAAWSAPGHTGMLLEMQPGVPPAGAPDQMRSEHGSVAIGLGPAARATPISTIASLVNDLCAVVPARLSVEPDAFVVRLAVDPAKADCLNEVALRFDRSNPGAAPIIFETETAAKPLDRPVLHISAIHAGSSPYLHLQDGKTLFLGAIVDGWQLTAIDRRGAEFSRDQQTFRLVTPVNGASQW